MEAAEGQGPSTAGAARTLKELWGAVGDFSKVLLQRVQGFMGGSAAGASVQDGNTTNPSTNSSRLYLLLCVLLLAAVLGNMVCSSARTSARRSDEVAVVQSRVAQLNNTLDSSLSGLQAALTSATTGWAANLSTVSAALEGVTHGQHQSADQILQLVSTMDTMQSQIQMQQATISRLTQLLGGSGCPADGSSNDTSCVPGAVHEARKRSSTSAVRGLSSWFASHISGPESALTVLGGPLFHAGIIYHSPSALDTRPLARLYLVLHSFFRPARTWGPPVLPTAHSLTNPATLGSHSSTAMTAGVAQAWPGTFSHQSCPLPLYVANSATSVNSNSTGTPSTTQLPPALPSLPAAAADGGPMLVLRLAAPVPVEHLTAVTLVIPVPVANTTDQLGGPSPAVAQHHQDSSSVSTEQLASWPANAGVHVLLQWAPDNSLAKGGSGSNAGVSQGSSSAASTWVSLGRLSITGAESALHNTASQGLPDAGSSATASTQPEQAQPPPSLRKAASKWLGARGWAAHTLGLPAPAQLTQGPGTAYVSHIALQLHGAPGQILCTPLVFLHGPHCLAV
jgi:hypothetical protein